MLLGVSDLLHDKTYHGLQKRYDEAWIKSLPSLFAELSNEQKWSLVRLLPGGRTAAVVLVESGEGQIVVKIAPDIQRSKAEYEALKILYSLGIGPKVFDLQIFEKDTVTASVITMELIGNGDSIRSLKDKEKISDAVVGEFMSKAIACGSEDLGIEIFPIESYLLEKLEKESEPGTYGKIQVTDAEKEEARLILKKFEEKFDTKTWVHGTLHPANLIFSARGIVAIDPRPFYASSCYDVAELCVKWGSEKNNHRHNLHDGIAQFNSLKQYASVDEQEVIEWMKILLATRA